MTTTEETMMTDHTEMQIPDDVMEAARRVVVDDLGMDLPGTLQSSYIDCIAEAILAERERCAKVCGNFLILNSNLDVLKIVECEESIRGGKI